MGILYSDEFIDNLANEVDEFEIDSPKIGVLQITVKEKDYAKAELFSHNNVSACIQVIIKVKNDLGVKNED